MGTLLNMAGRQARSATDTNTGADRSQLYSRLGELESRSRRLRRTAIDLPTLAAVAMRRRAAEIEFEAYLIWHRLQPATVPRPYIASLPVSHHR